MRFNKYIWELYKSSKEGSDFIKENIPLNIFPKDEYMIDDEESYINELIANGLGEYVDKIKNQYEWHRLHSDYFKKSIINSKKDIKDLFKSWVENGAIINGLPLIEPGDYEYWTTGNCEIYDILYRIYPDYFFPYDFDCEFDKVIRICEEFNIPLPEVPKKKDWDKRALYYLDICDAFLEFRKINDFTPEEMVAFIYDFAPSVIDELEDSELPAASKVWFVGANTSNFDFLDDSDKDSENTWQGNIDAKRGDIIVIYCLSPRSYIHSIWRASDDGFADPFFYFYGAVRISNPIKLNVHLTQKDLENNPVWSVNPLVRKNLQGINGYPIKYNEYLELLNMLKFKGENIEILPTIKPTSRFDTDELLTERDVEVRLIEPFLKVLKYSEKDWIRQMPVKMGRGERNYPDYSFGANSKKGEESAKMILESKYEIGTTKALREAYFQAKSYALRLQSNCFVIASKEGIWIYKPKDGVYKLEENHHYNWLQIENPDSLHEIQLLIGRQQII